MGEATMRAALRRAWKWLHARLFPPSLDKPVEPFRPPATGPFHGQVSRAAMEWAASQPGGPARKAAFKELFPPAAPPPWIPTKQAERLTLATDDALTPMYSFATAGLFGSGVGWMGFPYLAELTQRGEYRVISEVIAKEMTRKWIKLQYSSDGDKTNAKKNAKKLKELDKAFKRFRIQDLFRQAAEQDGFYGRSQLYIDTGDGDKPNELNKPLILDRAKIAKGGLRGFKVVEPMWVYPDIYNSTDPLHPHFFKPQIWWVNAKRVHVSRLLQFVSREVPDILKPAYAFAGMSMSQIVKPYVDFWLRDRTSVSDLINAFSIVNLQTELGTLIQEGAADKLQARVDFFNLTRNNKGTYITDKNTEELKNLAVPLGTLDALQAQAQEHMASMAQIPLVKLLGVTPSGLNASSDGEIRVFYDSIHARQEHLFNDPLNVVLKVLQLHLWGEIDENITFMFNPLWQLDAAAMASTRKTEADTAAVYIESGVLDPAEQRDVLASDDESPYAGLDPDDLPTPPESDEDDVSTSGDPAKAAEPRETERSGV